MARLLAVAAEAFYAEEAGKRGGVVLPPAMRLRSRLKDRPAHSPSVRTEL